MLPRWINVFSLFGSSVRLHASWLLLAPLAAWSLADAVFPFLVPELSPVAYWQMAVGGTVGLLLCILVREAAHVVVSRHTAIPPGLITVYLFGGVAGNAADQTGPKQEFVVMFMGSLVAFMFGVAILVLLFHGAESTTPLTLAGVLFYIGMASWAFALLNLIPAHPFRGGRVLRGALIGCLGRRSADRLPVALGGVLAAFLVLVGAALVMCGHLPAGLLSVSAGALIYLSRHEGVESSPR